MSMNDILSRVVSWEISCGIFPKISGKNNGIFLEKFMKYSKKCPQYHMIRYVRLKNHSVTEKVIMVNGPEV